MRLPERKKTLFSTSVEAKKRILQKPSEFLYASNHAFCYALGDSIEVSLVIAQ